MSTHPVRSVRVPDEEWLPFIDQTHRDGDRASSVLRRAIREYLAAAGHGARLPSASKPEDGAA